MRALTLLVVLLVTLAAGCGGDDGGGAESSTTVAPKTTAPATTTTPPVVPPVASGPKSDQRKQGSRRRGRSGSPSRRAGSTPESRQVERYLRDNFSGTGSGTKSRWYDHVVEVSVRGTTTTVRTDLSDDRTGRTMAREICKAVRGSLPGLTDAVLVTGPATHGELAKCVP